MTSGITTRRGTNKANMAMAAGGAIPWWQDETMQAGVLAAEASLEDWAKAAGLDYRVLRSVARYAVSRDPSAPLLQFDDKHVLFRSDNRAPLSVVSADYNVLQPTEVLEFFRDLLPEGWTLDTAGAFFGGKRYWAMAKRGGKGANVVGGDLVYPFLLFASSCDGSLSNTIVFTSERVVCDNTLRIALSSTDKSCEVRVSHRSQVNFDRVHKQLGLAVEKFDSFMEAARKMSTVKISEAEAKDLLRELIQKPAEVEAEAIEAAKTVTAELERLLAKPVKLAEPEPVKTTRAEADILALFQGGAKGSNLPGARGTGWGLVNAVTEYYDHHAPNRTASNRLANAWFGRGDEVKTATVEAVLSRA